MPDHPIVDAHLHLWDPRRFRMTWLDGNELLDRPYGLAEYRAHTGGLDIAAMVYLQVDVEPAYGLLEARWAAEQAREDPRIGAIVAYAPVEHGEVARSYLEALVAVDPRVRGVRRILQGEADPQFCLRPGFVRGVQILPEYGLSFDICIYHHQLPAAVELVRRCPQTSFMLDHLAKPDIRGRALDPWREHMRQMAALPNVLCKISGAVTEADHQRWQAEDLRPYVDHALACFGEDRVCFGGDWPVVLLASSYRRWVETLDALTAHLSPDARRKLWAENAQRFYRL
ncbi:MAG TPA: amidohydrolase family protein [Roseiflexaceae bacterium]|nr:amidohydrolase family protein [Roseiflexaceae bacterium]